jgi:hypothetical protein
MTKRIWIYSVEQLSPTRVVIECRPLVGDIFIGDVLTNTAGRHAVLRVQSIEVFRQQYDTLCNNHSGIIVCDIISGGMPEGLSDFEALTTNGDNTNGGADSEKSGINWPLPV